MIYAVNIIRVKHLQDYEPTGHYWFSLVELLKENNITIVQLILNMSKQSKELDDNLQTKNDSKDPKIIAKLVLMVDIVFIYS